MRYNTVIFDLDGTVLDTLRDLAAATNHALSAFGFPSRSVEEVRRFIGGGVAKLIRRAVPEGTADSVCDDVLACFKTYYAEHINDHTAPYAGICDLLRALRAEGIYVGINSNKYDTALQKLCRLHFDGLYDFAVGESSVTPKKPDPAAALSILERSGCTKQEAVYIGDSDVDLATAKNAGIDSVWVSWGFRKRGEMDTSDAKHCFDSVSDLKAFLLNE